MSSTNDEQANTGNTVTIMIGSYLNTGQLLTSGVLQSLLQDGNIGFDVLDGVMADDTLVNSYRDDLVSQLATTWTGSGSGLQEMAQSAGNAFGTVELTNTTETPIYVAAQGAFFYAANGSEYQTVEAPTNTAWTNGTSQSGSGVYVVGVGQTITVPVQALSQGNNPASISINVITRSSIAGLTVNQNNLLSSDGSYTVSGVNITEGGSYYTIGTSYTPTVTFSAGQGETALGHVSELFVNGGGSLGSGGVGYKVASYVPVESPDGVVIETINITSVGAGGIITSISVNGSSTLVTSVPAGLSIVQSGASGGTIVGANFGISSVAIDGAGMGYSYAPTITFGSEGAGQTASGTAIANESVQSTWLAQTPTSYNDVSTNYTVSAVDIADGGSYYMVGTIYTPTVTFSVSQGETAIGHVSDLFINGGGGLGSGGTGYKVANDVPVEDLGGDIIETINITSVGTGGAITGITVNSSNVLVTSVPAALAIVQSGATGGTMDGTNFSIANVVIDAPGTGYETLPTVTFGNEGTGKTALGTVISSETTQTSTEPADYGNYNYVFTDQGLKPAETYVSFDTVASWTSADVTSWEGLVQAARSDGILNVAPLENSTLQLEDSSQPFATSSFYAGVREAALYGGGLEIELPSYDAFSLTPTQWQTVVEEIRWCASNGIRSSLLIVNQGDLAGDPDTSFAADTTILMEQLATENALPSQVALQNDNSTGQGPYYDTDTSDQNSLNAVALDLDNDFALTPSTSEDGLEVKGASTSQTTLIMTGVEPVLDVTSSAEGDFLPYSGTQVFSEDPTKTLTLSVVDATGLISLSDILTGTRTNAGGTLTFSGTAEDATTFLTDLTASASPGETGLASLELTLTDYLGETTVGTTSIYLSDVHPTFTSVTESASSVTNNVVQADDNVTFTIATSAAVNVVGIPELVLNNEETASYAGQDTTGDLLFSYTVQPGDDVDGLRVRGIDLDGSSITDSITGLAIDTDSIDGAEVALVNPFIVNTNTDTVIDTAETSSSANTLGGGNEVTFIVGTSNPVVMVDGTPSLELNDGGIANYEGLNSSGQMKFIYSVPEGGAYNSLAPTSLDMNGAVITNSIGEAIVAPDVMPNPLSEVSYDATDTSNNVDTLVIALSADEYLGDAKADISLNGQQVSGDIDVSAVHSLGQTQLITITGNFDSAVNQLGISFTNDLWAGTATTDRNLYIDGVTFDGVSELVPTELNQTSTVITPISPSVQDKLQLWVSEDAANGNAMFSIDVDGNDVPGVYSTNIAHSSGQWQEIDIYGNFGVEPHTVTVTDLSGTWDNQAGNSLYVEQVGIDGVVQTASGQELDTAGESTAVSLGASPSDVLTLKVSEDAWNGDAQCYVTIDGRVFGSITTVTASHSAGAEQTITINAAGLSTGSHSVGLSFINDAWGGTANTDRNLYLDGAELNGANQRVSASLYTFGTANFEIGQEASGAVTIDNITSLITGVAAQTNIGAPINTSSSSVISGIGGINVSNGAVGSLVALLGKA